MRASLRSGGTERFFAFVLELQNAVAVGLVQLESDDFTSDIEAAIELHSGEAQERAPVPHR